jgi:hypothetical protein
LVTEGKKEVEGNGRVDHGFLFALTNK